MNFERVISHVAQHVQNAEVPIFLIGGLAMHAYDLARLTTRIDFLTRDDQRVGIVSFMEKSGYETLRSGGGFSNHLHPEEEWGRVDFVYSSEETVEKMLDAVTARVRIGDFDIPVPSPDHLIAMKVLAMRNEPRRTLIEMADIQHLMSLPRTDLKQVRGYFEKYGLLRRYDEIREVAF